MWAAAMRAARDAPSMGVSGFVGSMSRVRVVRRDLHHEVCDCSHVARGRGSRES
jgi:hypothetical protein